MDVADSAESTRMLYEADERDSPQTRIQYLVIMYGGSNYYTEVLVWKD